MARDKTKKNKKFVDENGRIYAREGLITKDGVPIRTDIGPIKLNTSENERKQADK